MSDYLAAWWITLLAVHIGCVAANVTSLAASIRLRAGWLFVFSAVCIVFNLFMAAFSAIRLLKGLA